MSQPETQPQFITFDVEQWRRDIQAFANTTREALNAIVSELSNQCSGRPARLSRKRDSILGHSATSESVSQAVTTKVDSSSKNRDDTDDDGGNGKASRNRLSHLKKKLAERLGEK